jgi:hypothetical protein
MPLGDGNYHYHYNTVETQAPAMEEGGEPRTQYESDTVFVAGEPTVAKIVAAVVHESYTDDDIALMTARHQAAGMGLDEEPEEYGDYLALVVAARQAAEPVMEAFLQEQQAAAAENTGVVPATEEE